MEGLVNIEQLDNVVKYYQFVKDDTSFRQEQIFEYEGFGSIDCYFSDNISSWSFNKKHIFDLFGGRLKIKKELKGKDLCNSTLVESMRSEFLESHGNKFNILIQYLLSNITSEETLNNKLSREMSFLDVTLKKGWRITKCFEVFEKNPAELDRQRNLYSILLQKLKIKGYLVLSIDPVDYITMSVSRSGWSSCHHPRSCHGLGGAAYMNDAASIVAYVETEEPMLNYVYDAETDETYEVRMPNKIWRQMVNINYSHEYALQMKEYPNKSQIYRKEVTRMLLELLEKEQGEKYCAERLNVHDTYESLQESGHSLEGEVFYCDYLQNNMTNFTAIFMQKFDTFEGLETSLGDGNTDTIKVGEPVICACGCGYHNYTASFYMEEDCGDEYYY